VRQPSTDELVWHQGADKRSTPATTIASLIDHACLTMRMLCTSSSTTSPLTTPHLKSVARTWTDDTAQPTQDLPGIAQVFSAVFAVLLAAMVGATLSGVVVAILTAAAAGCVCITIYVATNHRPWTQAKKMLVSGLAVGSLVMTGSAVAVAVSGTQNPASGTAASGSEASSAPWVPQTAAPRSRTHMSSRHVT
jgi:cytoskeletal protein RodZ